MTYQEDYDDDDDWNPCKAAGVCLSLMASCCENDTVPLVLPFVAQHLQNIDWKFRDAAVMALGIIQCIYRHTVFTFTMYVSLC